MNSVDREAVKNFKVGHLSSIPKMLKGTGHLNPTLHLFGRKHDEYGIAIIPIVLEGEIPVNVFSLACKKMFDELLCLSYSAEAFIWKGALPKDMDQKKLDNIMKDDPLITEMKKNVKPVDILLVTFESEEGMEMSMYEVKKTGRSMVTAYGEMTDDFELIPMADRDQPQGFGGRFANLFKKIKNYK
jgi:hypothetical protein